MMIQAVNNDAEIDSPSRLSQLVSVSPVDANEMLISARCDGLAGAVSRRSVPPRSFLERLLGAIPPSVD